MSHLRVGLVAGVVVSLLSFLPGVARAASASPASFSYGTIPINTTVTQDFTITVDSGYEIELASGSGINAPFAFHFDTCSSFVGPGTCNVKEDFSPTATGSANGTTNVFECPTGGGTCIAIPFDVSGAAVSLAAASPTSFNYGNVPINTTVTHDFTITVDSGYEIELASGSGINPPFGFHFDTCSSFVGPGTCNVKEDFTPTATGSATATTNVFECPTVGGTCIPIPFDVSGVGISLAAVSPITFNYGNVPINTTATHDFTVTVDSGYEIELASGSGINPPFGFHFDTCSSFVGPGTCNVKEDFTPTATGSASGTTNVFECPTAGGTCIPIPFDASGAGVSLASASPPTVDFGSVVLGNTVTNNVTITVDTGYEIELASGTGINAPFAFHFDTCSSFVGPGACNVKEDFSPTSAGSAGGMTNVFECPTAGGTCIPIPFTLLGVGVSPIVITTTSLPDGTVGVVYPATTVNTSGGTGAITYSITAGNLPNGLGIGSSTGTISGTPTVAGVFTFTVTATDSATPTPQTVSKQFTITVTGRADLSVSMSGALKPVPSSKLVTFTVIVKNLGPNATAPTIYDTLPSASGFSSLTMSQGTCTTPPIGATGTVICSLGPLASGASATIVITVQPAIKKGTLSNSATTSPDSNTVDPVLANNSATAVVQVK